MAGYARWDGYTLLVKRLEGIADIDYTPLMHDWWDLIIEDNRVKVLSGQDKFGNPAPDVKYRTGIAAKTRFRPRENPLNGRTGGRLGFMGDPLGRFKGTDKARGPKVLANNNLTTAAYKELTGPYGAPRRDSSRIITNLKPLEMVKVGDTWVAECVWAQVLDPKGRPFLKYLFKRYPIDGVRPVARGKASQMARVFVKSKLEAK